MPPRVKIQKEDIIKVAFNIAKKEGLDKMNARAIAKELNCSVQPIFHNFANMEEVKEKVIEKIQELYARYLFEGSKKESSYKSIGLAYIQFAKEEPILFQTIFKMQTNQQIENYMSNDKNYKQLIESGRKLTKLSFEEQAKFHQKVWIFTHGLADLVANHTCNFTQEEVEKLLTSAVEEMLIGYQINKGGIKSEKSN